MKKAKKDRKFIITADTPIIEITERSEEASDFLVDQYGFFCVGCPLAYSETIGEGAMVHGLDEEDIKKLIEELNKMINS